MKKYDKDEDIILMNKFNHFYTTEEERYEIIEFLMNKHDLMIKDLYNRYYQRYDSFEEFLSDMYDPLVDTLKKYESWRWSAAFSSMFYNRARSKLNSMIWKENTRIRRWFWEVSESDLRKECEEDNGDYWNMMDALSYSSHVIEWKEEIKRKESNLVVEWIKEALELYRKKNPTRASIVDMYYMYYISPLYIVWTITLDQVWEKYWKTWQQVLNNMKTLNNFIVPYLLNHNSYKYYLEWYNHQLAQ